MKVINKLLQGKSAIRDFHGLCVCYVGCVNVFGVFGLCVYECSSACAY